MKIFSIAVILVLSSFAFSQSLPKVYVPPMEDNFDSFLKSALLGEKVPVTITLDEAQADFVLVGTEVKGDNHWYNTVFGQEKDTKQGSVQLVRVSDKSVVWAGSAGDKSTWGRAWKKGGSEKVAGRLARRLKDEYFEKQK